MAATELRVDFNRADDGDVVWAYRDRADDPDGLEEGGFLYLYDWEGNACLGVVDRVDGELVYVALELSTWLDANQVTFTQTQPDLVGDLLTRALRIPQTELQPIEQVAAAG